MSQGRWIVVAAMDEDLRVGARGSEMRCIAGVAGRGRCPCACCTEHSRGAGYAGVKRTRGRRDERGIHMVDGQRPPDPAALRQVQRSARRTRGG